MEQNLTEETKRRVHHPPQTPMSRLPLEKQVICAMRAYQRREGHLFDLEHPVLFTEKRVWYALFYEHPDLTRIYDKYQFKEYIGEKLGPGWTAPLYGMWTRAEDFSRDWDNLPDAFCLKSNCSSLGQNVLFVRDKKTAEKETVLREAEKWLDPMNTGINSYCRAYRDIPPRILAEKLLAGNNGQLYDYKVLCFDGKPDHILATADRFPLERGALSYSFYDLSWNKLPVTTPGYRNRDIPAPSGLEKMIALAGRLSRGFPFVRVDFYDTTDGIMIGEMTFYSSPNYDQKEWDRELGEKFILPQASHQREYEASLAVDAKGQAVP